MGTTKIEWAEKVWNPVTGCTKIREGCKNCYAERMAKRFWGDRKFTDIHCYPDRLEQPLRWRKPCLIFVCSISDLFHEDVDERFIGRVFGYMAEAYWHTFIILTKRPKRALEWSTGLFHYPKGDYSKLPIRGLTPNLYLGVSISTQKDAEELIPILLQIPTAVRFVSVEPMLEAIDFGFLPECGAELDWVICGCESGPSRRPCKIDWIRSLRDQCTDAGVPFFLKQMPGDGKLVKMPVLDGKVWNQYPREGI